MSLSYYNNYYLFMFNDDYESKRLILGLSAFILVITNIIAKDKNLNYYWFEIVLHFNLLKNRSNR